MASGFSMRAGDKPDGGRRGGVRPSDMRVSDADREATAAELREHFASGRLTHDELNERLEHAFAARTRGDLDALMSDLPSARPAGTPGSPGASGAPGGPAAFGWRPGHDGPWGGGRWGGGTPSAADGDRTGQDAGSGMAGSWGSRAGWRGGALGAVFSTLSLICGLAVVAAVAVLGIGFGVGRPFSIVVLLAVLAFLRRLIFRRGMGRAGRCRRRW